MVGFFSVSSFPQLCIKSILQLVALDLVISIEPVDFFSRFPWSASYPGASARRAKIPPITFLAVSNSCVTVSLWNFSFSASIAFFSSSDPQTAPAETADRFFNFPGIIVNPIPKNILEMPITTSSLTLTSRFHRSRSSSAVSGFTPTPCLGSCNGCEIFQDIDNLRRRNMKDIGDILEQIIAHKPGAQLLRADLSEWERTFSASSSIIFPSSSSPITGKSLTAPDIFLRLSESPFLRQFLRTGHL